MSSGIYGTGSDVIAPSLPGASFPNSCWTDNLRTGQYDGRKCRLLSVIDEGNREALPFECGSLFLSTRLLRVLDELIDFYARPRAIRVDNGVKMTLSTHSLRRVSLHASLLHC
jgi:hypothetical protein